MKSSLIMMAASLLPLLAHTSKLQVWPKINTLETFKAQLSLFTCDGQQITPL